MLRYCLPWCVVGLVAVLLPGCGPSGPKLYPVRGKVSVKGKPAAHALVFLHRKGRSDPTEPVPYGKVAEDGQFSIINGMEGNGAPEGEYLITVYWPDMSKPEDGNGQRPDALNGAYDKVAKAKISTVVKPGSNEIPPLDLVPGVPVKQVKDPNEK